MSDEKQTKTNPNTPNFEPLVKGSGLAGSYSPSLNLNQEPAKGSLYQRMTKADYRTQAEFEAALTPEDFARIRNVNTTGFKQERPEFATLLYAPLQLSEPKQPPRVRTNQLLGDPKKVHSKPNNMTGIKLAIDAPPAKEKSKGATLESHLSLEEQRKRFAETELNLEGETDYKNALEVLKASVWAQKMRSQGYPSEVKEKPLEDGKNKANKGNKDTEKKSSQSDLRDRQFDEMLKEVDKMVQTTTFNGQELLRESSMEAFSRSMIRENARETFAKFDKLPPAFKKRIMQDLLQDSIERLNDPKHNLPPEVQKNPAPAAAGKKR